MSGIAWARRQGAAACRESERPRGDVRGHADGRPCRYPVRTGQRPAADAIRVLWPSGILQAETISGSPPRPACPARPACRPMIVEELDRKPSSCPFLFTWNGERFEFVTDFLGAGELGYWQAQGVRNTPDPIEYVRIRGDQLRANMTDACELRVTNELEETLFVDRLQLVAIAHPSTVDVYPNEGMTDAAETVPAVPGHRPAGAARGRRPRPRRHRTNCPARSHLSRRLRARANPWICSAARADPGPRPRGRARRARHAAADGVDRLRVLQRQRRRLAGRTVADAAGPRQSRTATADGAAPSMQIGIPGRPSADPSDRPVVAPPSPRARGSDRDHACGSTGTGSARPIGVASRSTRFGWSRLPPLFGARGFSGELRPGGAGPIVYDYARVSRTSPWKTMTGRYTREGDVLELVDGLRRPVRHRRPRRRDRR